MDALTVLGRVPAADLGLTLMHEHLVFDILDYVTEPRTVGEQAIAAQPVNIGILGALRFNPRLAPDNLVQRDVAVAIEEVSAFTAIGGQTLVDPTNASIGRDPLALQAIARATGLNVIMGSGYYTDLSLGDVFTARTVEEVTAEIVADVNEGVGDTGVCAGLIGEIGTSSPITPNEEKSLRAAARAQAETGAPLMVHMQPFAREGHRVLDIVAEEEGDVGRTVLCHMNPSYFDLDYQATLAERGAYIEYDMLGINYLFGPRAICPDELSALSGVAGLIERGYLERVLLSHDVYLKTMLCRYGGYGYAHLFNNLPPYFDYHAITPAHREVMLVDNPRRVLGFL